MWKSYVVFILYLAGCVIVGLLIAMLSPNECISNKCAIKTQLILESMDSKVAPCTNFYKFVCGRYKGPGSGKEEGRVERSVWEEMKEIQKRHLVQFLMRPETKNEDRVLRLLKMSYKSCLDRERIDSEGIQPLLNNIHHAGGFPLLVGESWERKSRASNSSLGAILLNSRAKGFSDGQIFHTYVDQLEGGKHSHSVHLSSPRHLQFASSHFDHLYSYLRKVLALLNGTQPSSKDVDKELNDTLRFKADLARINSVDQNCSVRFEREDLNEFSKTFSFLNLPEVLGTMIFSGVLPEHIAVTHTSRKYLSDIISLVEKTSKRVLVNYFIIENIIEVTPLLPTKFREAYREFEEKVRNPLYRAKRTRKIICLECFKGSLSSALSAFYLREFTQTYSKPNHLQPIFTALKAQLKAMVKRTEWMDPRTKREAFKKANAINFEVPFHKSTFDSLTNKTALRIYYEDLCFTGNTSDTLTNFLALQRFVTDKNWELLEREVEVFDLAIDIFSSEITFDQKTNTVLIPLSFLQLPVYFDGWPHYLNFGGFGSKVASEMVRSINSVGAAFDAEGTNRQWWSIETKAEYGKRTSCFMDQYNNYLKAHTKVKIQDPNCAEDIKAHFTGVKLAFLAYQEYEKGRFVPERRLKSFNQYSPKEMFYVDYATFYCDNRKDVYYDGMTEEQVSRASSEFNVLGPLRNFKDFQDLFHCSANDRMNAPAKCGL